MNSNHNIVEITSGRGALFIQRGGPNTPLVYMGFHGVTGYSEPFGEVERGYALDEYGDYVPASRVRSAPTDISFGITTGLTGNPSLLDSLRNCGFNAYIVHAACARPSNFLAYDRVIGVRDSALTSLDEGDSVGWDTDSRIPRNFALTGANPSIMTWKPKAFQLGTTGLDMLATGDFTSISPCRGQVCRQRCYGTCGGIVVVFNDGTQGGLVGFLSPEGGWTVAENRPFAETTPQRQANLIKCLDSGRIVVIAGYVDSAEWASSYSDDGGFSWVDYQEDPDAPVSILSTTWSIDAIGDVIIVGGTEGTLFRSDDGGVSWTKILDGDFSSAAILGVAIRNDSEVYAITTSLVLKSYDAGLTWVQMDVPTDGTGNMAAIDTTNQFVWIVGNKVWYSEHDRLDWQVRSLPTSYGPPTAKFYRVKFINDYVGAILQRGTVDGLSINRVFFTVTGGAHNTWVYLDIGNAPTGSVDSGFDDPKEGFAPAENFNDIAFCDYRTLYAVGDNRLAAKISAAK